MTRATKWNKCCNAKSAHNQPSKFWRKKSDKLQPKKFTLKNSSHIKAYTLHHVLKWLCVVGKVELTKSNHSRENIHKGEESQVEDESVWDQNNRLLTWSLGHLVVFNHFYHHHYHDADDAHRWSRQEQGQHQWPRLRRGWLSGSRWRSTPGDGEDDDDDGDAFKGRRSEFFFLEHCPKQRTPNTHPYGLMFRIPKSEENFMKKIYSENGQICHINMTKS